MGSAFLTGGCKVALLRIRTRDVNRDIGFANLGLNLIVGFRLRDVQYRTRGFNGNLVFGPKVYGSKARHVNINRNYRLLSG